MNIFETIILSFALAMDAFAVALSKGSVVTRKKDTLKIALSFGLFQGVMPVLGYILGFQFQELVAPIAHWIAFILLSIIGGKMVFESTSKDSISTLDKRVSNREILFLSTATSIDALTLGVSLSFLQMDILYIASFIVPITFVMCLIGGLIGRKVGDMLGHYAQLFGGIVLILLGLNILNQHTAILYNLFY